MNGFMEYGIGSHVLAQSLLIFNCFSSCFFNKYGMYRCVLYMDGEWDMDSCVASRVCCLAVCNWAASIFILLICLDIDIGM